MTRGLDLALPAACVFLGAYAALSAVAWLRRLTAERPARRKGMILNLARYAGPPVVAGGAVLVLGLFLGQGGTGLPEGGTGLPAALLAALGLALGLHRGLAEVGQNDWRSIAVRVALAVAATTGYLWLAGLAQGPAPV